MENFRNDFGPILDDFIREFDCDPSDREDLCLLLTAHNAALEVDARNEIERVRKKLAKRSEKKATEFARIVHKLRLRSDLHDADELILFFITYSAAHQYTAKVERDAKLAAANANTNTGSVTPTCKQRITKFTLSRSATPSSKRQSFFDARHTPILQLQMPSLTGRASGPSVVCEKDLLRHVLMALQGSEGVYIVLCGNNRSVLRLSDTLAVDDVLRVQLLRLLAIANAYLQLRLESQKSGTDRLARAFYTGLSEIQSTYMNLISVFYVEFATSQESLTCMSILLALLNWEMLLPFLLKIVQSCENLKGMQIFNFVCSVNNTNSNQFVQQFLQMLLRPMIYILHDCLNHWLVYGQLVDPGFEWMIQKNVKRVAGKKWTDKYKILNNAPLIFEQFNGLKEKIFFVGKTVSLLESMGMESNDSQKRKRTLSVVDPLQCYICISECHKLWCAVKKLSQDISSEVSQNIVRKYNMKAHFLAVQQHFLLNDECLALTFYENLKEEAAGENSMLQLDSQQASQAFYAAMQSCNSWPKQIAEYARIEATCGVMVEIDEIGSSHIIASPRDQYGCAVLRLNYDAKIPISIVLNECAMERYEKAFEFIWLLLTTDFELTATLHDHHCFMKNEPISDAALIMNVFTVLFARMSQFLYTLRSYVSYSVTSRLQTSLLLAMDNVSGDLDGLVEVHSRYLVQLEEGLFLNEENLALHNSFCALFALIRDLREYYSSFRLEINDTIVTLKYYNIQQRDLSGVEDTKFFEQEEERIQLEGLQQHLEEIYRPKVRALNSQFVLLVRGIIKNLLEPPQKLHYAELAHQLDLTGFYEQCEV